MSENPTKGQMGFVVSTSTQMNVSQARWDVIHHKAVDCAGAKRPTGCLVCEHDSANCTLQNCALCQAQKGIPFDDGTEYEYPSK